MGIKVADTQGAIDKSVVSLKVASVQGAINKTVNGGLVAAEQGAIDKKFWPDWTLKTGTILSASGSGPISEGYSVAAASVTIDFAVKPCKGQVKITGSSQISPSTVYVRVDYYKDGEWTYLEGFSHTIYNYSTTYTDEFEIPEANKLTNKMKYTITNLGTPAVWVDSISGKVTEWWEKG